MTPIVTTIADVRAEVEEARRLGMTVLFVPTMGALHEGHASLIRAAGRPSAFVVVSIFVNPTQFGPNEDFARYPRTLDADQKLCTEAGANLIFAPTAEEMYPDSPLTSVEVAELQDVLCGPLRPGHFRGVCTVVLKLFNIVAPDVAVFGEKDFQQSRIIRRMVRDLNVPVEIQIEPTVREADGLALSSRNRYLTAEQRAAAPGIHRALQAVRSRAQAGETDVTRLEQSLQAELEAIPGARVEYARIVDAETLQTPAKLDRPAAAAVAVAVFLGNTRLIDNITLP
jgi:pantoate--beta-alanine ligase